MLKVIRKQQAQPLYVAFTTQNEQMSGWRVVATGAIKSEVQANAEREICGDQWDGPKDIYVDTELKNLTVVSKSQALRNPAFRGVYRFWMEN